ncbi:MAG: hypothetical protein WD341_04890 [Tistlia sp.]|uniref:hypothetical protein n=1 Tax=Tistlia sp. TaxID=3057121 RepID=UPI0034A43BA3
MSLQTIDFAAAGLLALAAAVLAAAVVLLGGFLPLATRPAAQRGLLGGGLLLLAGLAALLLGAAALRLAVERLAVAPAVIAGGLGLLFGPLLFQLLPRQLRDGLAGLLLVLAAGGALALLLNQAAS